MNFLSSVQASKEQDRYGREEACLEHRTQMLKIAHPWSKAAWLLGAKKPNQETYPRTKRRARCEHQPKAREELTLLNVTSLPHRPQPESTRKEDAADLKQFSAETKNSRKRGGLRANWRLSIYYSAPRRQRKAWDCILARKNTKASAFSKKNRE